MTKRYFSVLIILLSLCGFYKHQVPVPNQEVVLQFADVNSISNNTEDIIAEVKEQLEVIGVSNIQVYDEGHGKLRIAYYSDANVAEIKKLLSESQSVDFTGKTAIADVVSDIMFFDEKNQGKMAGTTSGKSDESTQNPSGEENADRYQIDVYELSSTTNYTMVVDGKYTTDTEQKYDKYSKPNIFAKTNDRGVWEHNTTNTIAYKTPVYDVVIIDNTSYSIPDVRAGPAVAKLS